MTLAALLLPDGFHLQHYERLGSSNDEAKQLARAGAPQGTLVWADEQIAGRGRRGRQWLSPPGNLYLSLVWRPGGTPARAAQLGFLAALALSDALDPIVGPGLRLACKWPNDVLANGRKLAGILLESETDSGGTVDFVVLGVGVNLASHPERTEFPATSLAAEGQPGIMPAPVLSGFAHAFVRWAAVWQNDGFAPVRTAWLARAGGLGEPIRVRLEHATLDGRFLDIDEDGALLLDLPAAQGSRLRRIAAGEVFPAA